MVLTAAEVKYQLDDLRVNLFLDETEDTWEKIGKAISSITKLCNDGAYDVSPAELVGSVRAAHRPITNAMNSERTRLSVFPMELLSALATAMGNQFDQLLPLFMPPLLALCGRTSKVVINRAKSSILTIIEVTQLPTILSYFLQNVKEKSATMKIVIAEGTLAFLNSCNPPDVEKEARALEVEGIIRTTARDANADVRKLSRKIFENYQILLPSRVQSFSAPLSPTTKKYLDIKPTVSNTAQPRATSKLDLKVSTTSKPSHSRNPSTSTMSTATSGGQVRNPPTSMTRVSRKEPAPAPYMPQRPIQPSRVVVDGNPLCSTSTVGGPSRSAATLDAKRTLPPSRGQTQATRATSTTTTTAGSSIVPHRVPITTTTKLSASTSATAPPNIIPSTSTGPRRIPMPPPPPPAPKKEADGPKRPASRLGVDNATSTTSHRTITAGPVVPLASIKKRPISTVSSSVKDRPTLASSNPPAIRSRTVSKPPVPSAKASLVASAAAQSTSRAGASTTTTIRSGTTVVTSKTSSNANATKPLELSKSSKPIWGGRPAASAVPTKTSSVASAAQKAAPVTTRSLARKPSTRTVAPPRAGANAPDASKTVTEGKGVQRPVTPTMVALPPSPTPEDEEEKASEVEVVDDKNKENIRPATMNEMVLNQAKEMPVETATQTVDAEDASIETVVPKAGEHEEEKAEIEQNTQSFSNALVNDTPTPSANIPIPQITTDDAFDDDKEIYIQNDNDYEEEKDEEEPTSTNINSNSTEDPKTPQQHNGGLMAVPANNAAILSAKTPISALLNSIERGFNYDYSPITPLSPADCYLPNINGETPYSHQTHAPHIKGPMQPFNHALHAPGHSGIFGGFGVMNTRKEEELVRGDIGVVQLSEYSKQYVSASLPGLDEGRKAFTELNRS